MKIQYSSIFSDDIISFINLRSAQGYSTDHTEKCLRHFDMYCVEFPPQDGLLSRELIDNWLKYDISLGYRDISGRGRAIRLFGKYLKGMEKEAYVIPTHLFREKRKFTPYILSSDELVAFFNAADQLASWHCGDKFAPFVAPVIFRLMYTSGLRPSEVCALENKDVNLTNGEILIRINKKKKERIIVVSDDMLRLLNEYVIQKENVFVRTSYFFPRIDGSQYTSQQLGKLCDKCWIIANPERSPSELPRLRPYDFRHSFASSILQKWINEGKDLYVMLPYLRTYMGHEHFSDTAYYVHILPERLISSTKVDWNTIDSVMPEVDIWD